VNPVRAAADDQQSAINRVGEDVNRMYGWRD
jgi:hypothetical protein